MIPGVTGAQSTVTRVVLCTGSAHPGSDTLGLASGWFPRDRVGQGKVLVRPVATVLSKLFRD